MSYVLGIASDHTPSPANRTSAFSSSHDIHFLRYSLPFATVAESPTTHSWRFARVIPTVKKSKEKSFISEGSSGEEKRDAS